MRKNILTGVIWEEQAAYSRAVRIGHLIEVSGTTAVEGATVVGKNDVYAQTVFVLQRIEKALGEAGATLNDVIRTRIYVADISEWELVAKAHHQFFKNIKPATTLVEVSALINTDLLVEIEASAVLAP